MVRSTRRSDGRSPVWCEIGQAAPLSPDGGGAGGSVARADADGVADAEAPTVGAADGAANEGAAALSPGPTLTVGPGWADAQAPTMMATIIAIARVAQRGAGGMGFSDGLERFGCMTPRDRLPVTLPAWRAAPPTRPRCPRPTPAR